MPAIPLNLDALLETDTAEPRAPERCRESDRRRLQRLVDDQLDSIWRFLRRLGVPAVSVDDAVQEVYAVAARRISEIETGAEKSFLFGTAMRVAQGARRRHARELARYESLDERDPPGGESPEQMLSDRRALAMLDQLLESLGDDARSVFVLFELEGFTFSEIAQLLEIPRGTVASRLRRARSDFMRGARRLRERGQP